MHGNKERDRDRDRQRHIFLDNGVIASFRSFLKLPNKQFYKDVDRRPPRFQNSIHIAFVMNISVSSDSYNKYFLVASAMFSGVGLVSWEPSHPAV